MSAILSLAQAIQDTSLGVALAESKIAFPIIEGVHLIGLSISVGLIVLTDLRLLGLILRHIPVTDILHQLRPLVLGSFGAIFISGVLLFISEAETVIKAPPFLFKFIFIAFGGLNALYFEFVLAKQTAVVENHPVLPANVRYAGLASIVLWTLVIISGRLIPYITEWA